MRLRMVPAVYYSTTRPRAILAGIMSTRTEILAIRLLHSKRAPELTEKELLKSAKRIWSLDRHQTYQKPSEIHHNCQIPAQRRKLYSIVPVQLEVAERERESATTVLHLWR